MKIREIGAIATAIWLASAGTQSALAASDSRGVKPERIEISGELIDTWCYVTEIMYALGSAHHRCAVWCAVGGIPVSIRGDDGMVYMVLRVGEDGRNVADPGVVRIQSHQVTVSGDLYVRDGVNYVLVDQVEDDQGVVNITHPDYGIVPF